MTKRKPIFWHQGMFLQPQHFQQNELYQQSMLSPFRQYMQPHFWGVAKIKLVESALEHRSCELQEGEFVFPDGTHVSVPDNAYLPDRLFDEDWVDPDKPFTIYIGLRKTSSFEPNVTVIQDATEADKVKTRYFSYTNPEDVSDIYQDGPDAQVKSLNFCLRFIFDNETDVMNDYVLIPVAQIVREGENLRLSRDFVPPLLSIASSPDLFRLIKDIRDDITGRGIQLDHNNTSVVASTQFDPNIFRYRLGLHTLSRFAPQLYHICESEDVHPWVVYGVIRELVGEVSTFTRGINMLGETNEGERLLPSYDHSRIYECFHQARALITRLLNEITIGPQYLVDMNYDGTSYSADIPADFFSQQVDFFMIVNTHADWAEHEANFFTSAKLATRDTVSLLVERSLPGVGMVQLPSAPAGLPRRSFSTYIKLDVHDENWAKIQQHQNAALYWDEAPDDLHVELVVMRK